MAMDQNHDLHRGYHNGRRPPFPILASNVCIGHDCCNNHYVNNGVCSYHSIRRDMGYA